MSDILFMGTSLRHNRLLAEMYHKIVSVLKNESITITLEQLSLCYYGEPKEPDFIKLIDVQGFDTDSFNYLYAVQPDLMLFRYNPFLTNKEETRFIGKPDLIVEVWSKSNDKQHKLFKKKLYSSSDITEHWYINQHSNKIKCFLGQHELQDLNLKSCLKTQTGIDIDLRHLAI